MELPVKNYSGAAVAPITVDDAVFGVPMNHALVHQAVIMYQDNKRQGTHDTKTRGQVSGGGRKPWIQKHTGRARQGSIRSPQWRHGGVVFGPHPRDYRKEMPRRMRQLALKCALSEKARRGAIICLESLDQLDGKTRSMANLLGSLGISGSALVVTENSEPNVVQAAHNLKGIWTLPVNQLNAHELLRRETVIMTVSAARRAEAMWAVSAGHRARTSANGAAMANAVTTAEGDSD
jgi:large subunit ribosomal protein L4